MIYKDIHQFLLTKASAKEIDIMLELVNNIGWDEKVRVDEYDIATRAGTTVRYVRDVLKRFTSIFKGKRILKRTGEREYRVLKGKSVVLHRKSDTYCKQFTFLHEKEFKGMSVYGKRIILKAAYRFSLTGQREAYLAVDSFIYRNNLSSGLIPSRTELNKVVQEMNGAFKGQVCVSVVSSLQDKKEYIYVKTNDTYLNEVRSNRTERDYIRKELFSAGYVGYLDDDFSKELEKVGKYIFNTLVDRESGGYKGDFTRDMMELSREIYKKSIKRLAGVLHGLLESGQSCKAVSAYFSRVVYSVMLEELVKVKNKIQGKWDVIRIIQRDRSGEEVEQEIQTRVHDLEEIITILEEWGYNWVRSRYKESEGNFKKNESNLHSNRLLKESIEEEVYRLEDVIKENTRIGVTNLISWVREYKRVVSEFIDIGNERLFTVLK